MNNTTTGTNGVFRRKIANKLTPELFKKRLKELFPETDEAVVGLLGNSLIMKIKNLKMNSAFVMNYSKGEIDKIINISSFIDDNDISCTNIQCKEIYKLIQQLIVNRFSPVQCMRYIKSTFPLWSELKRQLLKTRPGTDKKQWEFVSESCKTSVGFVEHFSKAVDYKQLNNEYTAEAVSNLVNMAIPGCRFENIISQPASYKGWFPAGLNYPPHQHNVQIEVLFKLAYGLALPLEELDRLFNCSVNGKRDPYDFNENMLRFGLKYRVSYKEIHKLIENAYKGHDKEKLSYFEAVEKVDSFFKENHDGKSVSILAEEFIDIASKIAYEKSIKNEQRENAAKYMQELLEKTDVEKIKAYYPRPDLESTDTLADENFCEADARAYKKLTDETRYSVMLLEKRNKVKALYLICDGLNFKKIGLSSKAFTRADIINIADNKKEKIHRDEILRIGYLTTLIDFINGDVTKTDLISRFEDVTGKMLAECHFQSLNITFLTDVLMYISLASNEMCIPEVYQLFIPKNIT